MRNDWRLVATALGVADLDAATAQLGDHVVEVVHLDGEVLPDTVRHGALDQVDLLASEIEPRPAEAEVRPIRPLGQPEHIDIEALGGVDVADVDRDMVDTGGLHGGYSAPPSNSNSELDDSVPALRYTSSFERLSSMSRLRIVSWPIRSSGPNGASSTFSIDSRSGE